MKYPYSGRFQPVAGITVAVDLISSTFHASWELIIVVSHGKQNLMPQGVN
jgi:hypothetical protein